MKGRIDLPLSYYLDLYRSTLNDADFKRLSSFIMNEYGIKLPPAKKIMLESRLQKRLRSLKITDFKTYVDYLFSPVGQRDEVVLMMDAVSTNKTDFFREPVHFDYLSVELLPRFYSVNNLNIKLWSAGCSSGEEPYTLAIVLNEFKEKHPGMDFSIYGTDISTRMLKTAVEGVYKEERIGTIPLIIKKKYFLKSRNAEEKKVKVATLLRNKIRFERLNLNSGQYSVQGRFDVIFCRNVLIYFDHKTQEQILQKLCSCLKTAGYLFLGHSESITGMKLPLQHIQPTIYERI